MRGGGWPARSSTPWLPVGAAQRTSGDGTRREGAASPGTTGTVPIPASTLPERVLLVVLVVFLPFDDRFGAGGVGVTVAVFAVLGLIVGFNRGSCLVRVAVHRRALPAFLFLLVTLTIEFFHPLPSITWWVRVAEMVLGMILIGSVCRDRRAIRAVLYAIVGVALVLGLPLTVETYGSSQAITASDFTESSQARSGLLSGTVLAANGINVVGTLMALGCAVAAGLSLTVGDFRGRVLLIGTFCLLLLATFLSFSRGAVLAAIAGGLGALLYHRSSLSSRAVRVLFLIATFILLVPAVILPRLTFSGENQAGKPESRSVMLDLCIQTAPEYLPVGVGSGNFWEKWGIEHGFNIYSDSVDGVHNGYLQTAIQWGLPGLAGFLLMLIGIARCLPPRRQVDPFGPSLAALFLALSVTLLVAHNIYDKYFAVGFGIILGYGVWMRPAPRRPGSTRR